MEVGHTASELSPNRTLASLYLNPLMSLIQAMNVDSGTVGLRFVKFRDVLLALTMISVVLGVSFRLLLLCL